MKKFKLEIYMILLSLLTLCIWYLKDLDFKYGLFIYILIFVYLIIKQKPVSYFIIVILFSVMSIRSNSGIFIIDYILVAILFLYVVFNNIKDKYLFIGNLFFPLIIYFFYNVLSIVWTPIKSDGFHGIIAMLEGYLIYYIITNGKIIFKKDNFISISKISTFLMFTLSLEIIYSYHLHGFVNIIYDKLLIDLGWGFSNLISVIFVFLIPIALYKYFKKFTPFYILLDIINIFGLLLTMSRGAFVGVVISLFFFILFYIRRTIIIKYGSILVLVSIPIIFIGKLHKYIFSYINHFISDNGRFLLYKVGWESFLDKILFGNGIKSSKYLIKSSKYLIHYYPDGRTNVHFHNFILQIAATLGIVGLILFMVIVYKWFVILYKKNESYVMCVAFSIIGALTHQLLDVSFDLFFFGLYFYTLIGIVEIYRHNLKDDDLKMKIVN